MRERSALYMELIICTRRRLKISASHCRKYTARHLPSYITYHKENVTMNNKRTATNTFYY